MGGNIRIFTSCANLYIVQSELLPAGDLASTALWPPSCLPNLQWRHPPTYLYFFNLFVFSYSCFYLLVAYLNGFLINKLFSFFLGSFVDLLHFRLDQSKPRAGDVPHGPQRSEHFGTESGSVFGRSPGAAATVAAGAVQLRAGHCSHKNSCFLELLCASSEP